MDLRGLDIFSVETDAEEAAFFTGMCTELLRLVRSSAPTKAEEARFARPRARAGDEREARHFLLDMTKRCCFTLTTTGAALHYCRKLVQEEKVAFNTHTWRTIWVVAMVLAEKYWEDNYVHPVHILQTYSGDSKSADYSDMQNKLFEMLERQMNLPPEEFHQLVQDCIALGRRAPEQVEAPVFVPRPLPEVKKWVHTPVHPVSLHVPRAAYKEAWNDRSAYESSSTTSGCVTDCESSASNASFHGAPLGYEHRQSRARFMTSANRSYSVQYPRGPSPPMRNNALHRSTAHLDIQDPRRPTMSRLRLHDVRSRSPTNQTRSARALPPAFTFEASPLSGSRSARGRPTSPRGRPERALPRAPAAANDRQATVRTAAAAAPRYAFKQPLPVQQALQPVPVPRVAAGVGGYAMAAAPARPFQIVGVPMALRRA